MENQRLLSMQKKYYRTFIGLPVEVGERVLEARNELMSSLQGERISWVDPDRYHVTFRFIGDTEVEAIERISQALKEHVQIPVKKPLQLANLGSFGPRKKPRVIWLGFEATSFFEGLKSEVDNALNFCGIPDPCQPFRAHLTLGRIRSLKDLNGFYHTVDEMKYRFKGKVWMERLIFYRSELGSGGPVYIPLQQIEFNDS
jgi:2'-5' RNA ligase